MRAVSPLLTILIAVFANSDCWADDNVTVQIGKPFLQGVTSLAFHPNGKSLFCGSNGLLAEYDLAAKTVSKVALPGQWEIIDTLAISRDGKTLVAGDTGGSATIWNLESGNEIARIASFKKDSHFMSAGFSPDGKKVVLGGSDMTVGVWNVADGKEIAKYEGHKGCVSTVAVAPDGTLMASGDWAGDLIVTDFATGKERFHKTVHKDRILGMAWASDGKTLVTGGRDADITLWDTTTWNPIATLPDQNGGREVGQLVLYDNDTKIAAGNLMGLVTLWDIKSKSKIGVFGKTGILSPCISMSKDEKLMAVGDMAGTVHIVTMPK